MSNPWLKFYPSDWRADPALRMCSIMARGLWMEMLCVMHEATPHGSLRVNGRGVTDRQLASLAGASVEEVADALAELEEAGVFSRDGEGVPFSRRMQRDFEKAARDKANGGKGGNPSLIGDNAGVNPSAKAGDKAQKPEARSQKNPPSGATPLQTPKGDGRKQGSALPEDWEPSQSHYELATERQRPPEWVDEQAKQMRDWAMGNANRPIARKADWDATFRNWLKKHHEAHPLKDNRNGQRSISDQVSGAFDRFDTYIDALG